MNILACLHRLQCQGHIIGNREIKPKLVFIIEDYVSRTYNYMKYLKYFKMSVTFKYLVNYRFILSI